MSGGCGVRLVLVSALTPLHPGAGRAPGLVDLPVVRDHLGIPHLRGSMLKGALKTHLGRLKGCIDKGQTSQGYIINCNKSGDCRVICALLGGEVGQGPEGASALSMGDLYPLAVPAPLLEIGADGGGGPRPLGVGYVTTSAIASYVASIAEEASLRDLAQALSRLAKKAIEAASSGYNGVSTGHKGTILVGTTPIKVESVQPEDASRLKDLAKSLKSLNPLYSAYEIPERLVVLEDTVGSKILEGLMDRRARVRLERETKTVASGGLWTEEYLPWGSLLAGPLADTGFRNRFADGSLSSNTCAVSKLSEIVGQEFSLVLGGKESVGGGLARVKIVNE